MLKLVSLALLLAAAAPASAQAPVAPAEAAAPTAQAARGRAVALACRTDIRAYCSDVQPGGGRFLQCFRRNADKLTPACMATLKSLRGAGAPQG